MNKDKRQGCYDPAFSIHYLSLIIQLMSLINLTVHAVIAAVHPAQCLVNNHQVIKDIHYPIRLTVGRSNTGRITTVRRHSIGHICVTDLAKGRHLEIQDDIDRL